MEKCSGCYKSSVILRVLRSLWVDPKALIKTSDWVAEQKVGYQYNVVPCDTGSFAFSQHLPPTAGCPRLPKATSSFVRFSSCIRPWKTSPLSLLHVAYIIHKKWWASGLAMLMSGAYVVNGFLVFSKLFFLLFFFSLSFDCLVRSGGLRCWDMVGFIYLIYTVASKVLLLEFHFFLFVS